MSIKAENISRGFTRGAGKKISFNAVNPTDFVLEPGTFTVLKGKSGSGKSTLINLISGLLKPSQGRVLYEDVDLYEKSDKKLSEIRNQFFGYITQIQSPIASLTVIENVLLPYTLFDEKTDYLDAENEYYKRAEALLEKLGILHLKEAMPSELSGGELKRMMIARALVRDPKYIFADEPTADLDKVNTVLVFNLLREYTERGAAVLMATHEDEAAGYADKLYEMEKGDLQLVSDVKSKNDIKLIS